MTEPATKRPRKKRWGLDDQGGEKEEIKARLWAIANRLSVKLGCAPVDPAAVPKPAPAPLSCVLNPFSGLPLYPAPGGLVAGQRKQRKIYVPTGPLPAGKGLAGDTNYLGLLIGPRGATQKTMEQESGAKILIRGKGSSKDGSDAGDTEDLHVLIMGDTDAQVDKAAELVEDLLFNVDKREKIKTVQLRQVAELSNDGRTPNLPPVPSDSTTIKEIWIPQDRVGLVIGKGGETIKQLQMSTGCHIQIARESGPDNTRSVTIGGTEEQIKRAEVEIYYVVDKEGKFTPPTVLAYAAAEGSSGSSIGRPGIGFDGKDDMTINIPQNMVGLLIGKGGETIRQLQEKTGAHIQVTKDSESDPHSGTRAVRLGGTPQQLEHVRKEIDALIENQIRGNPGLMLGPAAKSGIVGPDGSRTVSVYVPGAHVGVVIGRGGETIKRLQAQTGARIQVSKDDSLSEREIILCGTDRQLEFARSEINILVSEAVRRDEMRTPVIARGGSSSHSSAGQPTTMSQKLQQIAQEKQAAMAAAYENMDAYTDPSSGTAAVSTDMYGYYYPGAEYFAAFGSFDPSAMAVAGKEGDAPAVATAQASWTPEQMAAYYAYYGYTYTVAADGTAVMAASTDTTTTDTTTATTTSTTTDLITTTPTIVPEPGSEPIETPSPATTATTTRSETPFTTTATSSDLPTTTTDKTVPTLLPTITPIPSSPATPSSSFPTSFEPPLDIVYPSFPKSSPMPTPPPVPVPPTSPAPDNLDALPELHAEEQQQTAENRKREHNNREKIAREKFERLQFLREKVEKEKLEAERIEKERVEKERLEREKALREAISKKRRGSSMERPEKRQDTIHTPDSFSDGPSTSEETSTTVLSATDAHTSIVTSSTTTTTSIGDSPLLSSNKAQESESISSLTIVTTAPMEKEGAPSLDKNAQETQEGKSRQGTKEEGEMEQGETAEFEETILDKGNVEMEESEDDSNNDDDEVSDTEEQRHQQQLEQQLAELQEQLRQQLQQKEQDRLLQQHTETLPSGSLSSSQPVPSISNLTSSPSLSATALPSLSSGSFVPLDSPSKTSDASQTSTNILAAPGEEDI